MFLPVSSIENGLHNGKRYFSCPPGHGAMVRVGDIHPLATPASCPPVTGNKMYPSYKDVCRRRKDREQK